MKTSICNICGKSYNGDQYANCPHCQGIIGQWNITGSGSDGPTDKYEDKKTVFYQEKNEDQKYEAQTDLNKEMIPDYSSDYGEVGSFICGNGHKIEGVNVTYCPFCGDRNIRKSGDNSTETTCVLTKDAERTDISSDDASGESKKRKNLHPVFLIVGTSLAVLGIILFIVGMIKLGNAEEILEKAERSDTTKATAVVSADASSEQPTEQPVKKPELTGIRVLMYLDKPYGISNASMMYSFQESGETLNTRNTAKFRLEVQPVPEDAEIPEVEWAVSDTKYMEINGSTVKMTAETADLNTLPSITAKTKDGKYSVSVKVDIAHAGWVWIGEHRYYITGSGKGLKNEWWESSEKKLYVNEEGYAVMGWQIITDENGRSAIYHFDEKTAYMDRNTQFIVKDGNKKEYTVYINENGEAYDSWVILNGKWYYCDETGTMLKSTKWGKYSFDENGVLIE